MPLGIVSDEEFEAALRDNGKSNTTIVDINGPGRRNGDTNIPDTVRKVIIDEALEGTSREVISDAFGISKQSVTNSIHGSRDYQNKPEIEAHIKTRKEKIVDRASGRLIAALKELSPSKISQCDAKDISSIAKDMSQVIRNLEPEQKGSTGTQANFVFFAPNGVKNVSDYEVIDSRD